MNEATSVVVDESDPSRGESVQAEGRGPHQMLAEDAHDIIFVIGRDGNFEHVGNAAARRLGIQPEHLLGRPASLLFPGGGLEGTGVLRNLFDTGEPAHLEHRISVQGRELWLYTSLSAIRGADGRITAALGVSRDISDFVKMRDELRTLTLLDELTGLYNRRALTALADQQLRLADRMNKGMAVVLADLDDLKQINDSFGHRAGDTALIAAASVLRQAFRESDIIARTGGDEFVVLAIWVAATNLETLGSRLDAALKASNDRGTHPFRLSFSYGIAHYDPGSPRPLEDLLELADSLMYQQKSSRKRS